MTEPETPPASPLDHIAPADTGTAMLVAGWQKLANPELAQPAYNSVPTLEEHIAAVEPDTVARQQSGRPMRSWHTKRVTQAAASYPHAVQRVIRTNEDRHQKWLSTQASILTELTGLAILSGDDDAAQRYAATAAERGADLRQSDKVGLALLARGDAGRAKPILLGGRDKAVMQGHAHSLFDAYAWTGDPEYRERLITVLPYAKFLVARLAGLDIAKERPIGDLFDVADGPSGARLVLALTVANSKGVAERGQFKRYIKDILPKLHAPERKTVTPVVAPPPPAPTALQRVRQQVRRDGIFGLLETALDKALDVADGALDDVGDIMFGGGSRPAPEPPQVGRPRTSPEFRQFLDEMEPLIGRARPWLLNHDAYEDEGYGDIERFKGATAHAILLARANAGHDAAAVQLLDSTAAADIKYYAYRNLLHGTGSTALRLTRLIGPDRRAATYYTLVVAARSATVMLPDSYELRDDFGQLQTLYANVAQAAAEQRDESQPRAGQVVVAEAELTNLRLLNKEGVADVFAKIRALNDPAAERAALERLAERLRATGGK